MLDRHTAAALLAGALGGAAGACCVYHFGRQAAWWRAQAARADEGQAALQPPDSLPAAPGVSVADAPDDEILREQFTRNRQFFGQAGQRSIHEAFVVVVGLGGVGSHAAHMLLRAGVGRLRLIDFDQVSLSSLNRHAVATRADVGLPKATVLKEHFARIVPEAEVDARRSMFTADGADELLSGSPDVVIDAIDDISTKVALLVACQARGLQVVCCCGAGAKADPSKLSIADVSEASCDPLARKVRHLLRAKHGIETGVAVVLSPEKPRCGLTPVEQLSAAPAELQIVPNFRVRTVPVLGTTPAAFGMAAAAWALCRLAGQPFVPQPMFHVRDESVERLLDRLALREEVAFGASGPLQLDIRDACFLVRDVWRAKSARALLPGMEGEKALSRFVDHLQLTRWDRSKAAAVDNLLLLTEAEADAHDQTSLEQLRAAEPAFFARVEGVLAAVRQAFGIEPAAQ